MVGLFERECKAFLKFFWTYPFGAVEEGAVGGIIGAKRQPHRHCGLCGRSVRIYNGSRKCDGWHWHKKCWRAFLRLAARIGE